MEIEYELTKEDFLDFNLNHAHNSSTVKKSLFYQRYVVAIIFPIIPVILSKTFKAPLRGLLPAYLISSLMWIIFYPKYFWWQIKKNVTKTLDESEDSKFVASHSLTISEKGMVSEGENSKTVRDWGSIQRIDKTDRNILIYTGAMEALIVPLRAFDDEVSLKSFIEEVERFSGKTLKSTSIL